MRRARRVLAIDWSGDARHAASKIWLCEVARGRVLRLECGRTREGIADHLIEEARRAPDFVVGLDFAFSFPAGFLRKRGHRSVESVWAEARALGEGWLASCPNPPFWGKPGKRRPGFGEALFRATDLAVEREVGSRPKSVFQIGGAGAVGVGSIRGMPVLERLRQGGFSVWPFHEPGLPLVLEIWPRVFTGPVVKSRPTDRQRYLDAHCAEIEGPVRSAAANSDDAFDALISALAMDRHRKRFDHLEMTRDETARLEGAIWTGRAIPGPGR